MPHYEDKKAQIVERMLERKRKKQGAVEVEVEVSAPEEEPMPVMDFEMPEPEEEFEEDVMDDEVESELESLQSVFDDIFEDGFKSYLDGADVDDNPYTHEDMVEDEDNPEFILSELWSDGWVSAHTEACMANLVLLARKLTTCEEEEEGNEAFDLLVDAVRILGEVVDYSQLEEAWGDYIS